MLSVTSIWEMQIKAQTGKLTLRLPLEQLVREQQHVNGVRVLPIRDRHVFALNNLPIKLDHKDPFDRLLIAQSVADGMSVVTADPSFRSYPASLIY